MGLRDIENIEVPGQGLRRVEILPMKTAVGFTGKSIKRMDVKIKIISQKNKRLKNNHYKFNIFIFDCKVRLGTDLDVRLLVTRHIILWGQVLPFDT